MPQRGQSIRESPGPAWSRGARTARAGVAGAIHAPARRTPTWGAGGLAAAAAAGPAAAAMPFGGRREMRATRARAAEGRPGPRRERASAPPAPRTSSRRRP